MRATIGALEVLESRRSQPLPALGIDHDITGETARRPSGKAATSGLEIVVTSLGGNLWEMTLESDRRANDLEFDLVSLPRISGPRLLELQRGRISDISETAPQGRTQTARQSP